MFFQVQWLVWKQKPTTMVTIVSPQISTALFLQQRIMPKQDLDTLATKTLHSSFKNPSYEELSCCNPT